jgi:ABC-type antimicrobial peptide transport system permease subunit
VQLLALNRSSGVLLAAIVFIVASLGVVNTMLMAVLERTRELGVQKALGMSGAGVFSMVLGETALLALAGAMAGSGLGLGMDLYLVQHGVDLSFITGGVSFAGIGMQPVVYGAITPGGVLWPIAILSSVCLLAAVYPALRAARMPPAVGMRET